MWGYVIVWVVCYVSCDGCYIWSYVVCHVMVIIQYGMVDIYEGVYPVMVVIYEGLCYQVMVVLFECVCDIILDYHVCDVAEDRHGGLDDDIYQLSQEWSKHPIRVEDCENEANQRAANNTR